MPSEADKTAVRRRNVRLKSHRPNNAHPTIIKTNLNQAEDIFPLGFFASSRPAIAESTQRGKGKEKL